ncbi:MAG: hypothetical protein JXA53_03890 [Bacteroidales bacterium]|nr:hypothetical protein [Bacteroidales bacterium]
MKKLLIGALFFGFLFSSCKNSNKPNVDNINVKIEVGRLDSELFAFNKSNSDSLIASLKNKYGDFFNLYTSQIINIGNCNQPQFSNSLLGFVSDPGVNKLVNAKDSVFSNFSEYQEKLQLAFKYYKYYFPERNIPQIITQISALNQSVVVTNSVLAISIDKYLGSSYPLYEQMGFYKYQQEKMSPEYLVADAVRVWIQTEFVENIPHADLVSTLLSEAKIAYITSLLLPEADVRLAFNYSAEEYKWCLSEEKHMWDYLIENNLLFGKDKLTIRHFVGNGPFTSEFGKESPGRAAVWLGYNIICSYMKNNPQVTIQQLVKNTDYRDVLQQSKYRP